MPTPADNLEPDEKRLRAYLQFNCRGIGAARTQERIAEDLGWPRRKVHDLCARLRVHGYLVGSSCGGADPNHDSRRAPLGMYRVETQAEKRMVLDQLTGRLREAYQAARVFGHTPIPELDRQLKLTTEDAEGQRGPEQSGDRAQPGRSEFDPQCPSVPSVVKSAAPRGLLFDLHPRP